MNNPNCGNIWKLTAVFITCCMMIAAGQQKTAGSSARTAPPKWFCIAMDPVGIIIDYKKVKTGKSSFSDTCSSVWYHNAYGYKLYLKKGDSVRICPTCLTWGRFLDLENRKNSKKSVQKISEKQDIKNSDNKKKEKKRKKK